MREKNRPLTPEEKWEQATLANNFIFYKVMRNHPDECKELLELLLEIKIDHVDIASEETIDIDHDSKGVRLDVYAKNSTHVFDVEVQVANTGELPERARYYQSVMDIDSLKSGELYKDLKDSHVIFLCMEDIFDKGLPVYTFENICRENNTIYLDDRSYKHFFIAPTCAKMLTNNEQKAFFDLLTANKGGTSFTDRLKTFVDDAKLNTQWRMQFMTWERQQAMAFQNGRTEGAHEKALESARNMLADSMPAELVAKYTGLSLAEVQQLAAETGK